LVAGSIEGCNGGRQNFDAAGRVRTIIQINLGERYVEIRMILRVKESTEEIGTGVKVEVRSQESRIPRIVSDWNKRG
jgi:hypothetical protein